MPTSLLTPESLFLDGRTARKFTDEPVSDAELSQIWELTRQVPTFGNAQPLRVTFVRTSDGKERLMPLADEGNRRKIAAAAATAIVSLDTRFHDQLPLVSPQQAGMYDMLERNEAARLGAGELSAGIQIGAFILAVRAVGLAAGPMGGFDRAGVDAEFLAGTTWRSRLLINIGHPTEDAWHAKQPRVPLEDAVAWA